MELVRGVPITEYCDQYRLTPRQRLELFLSLCHAIQHAHQKGIIHRDIKPSNVLVTLHDGRPVVKVIDFGVAKALSQQLTERTIYTQFAQMLGTPLYMSPEQAEMSGLDIDTRSDIYSLGVMLYELLTGTTPFDRKRISNAAALEIRRILCDEEPPKPSTRLSQTGELLLSIAAQRNMEPANLSKLIRGDLDWIVMKCLEKDRNRRYETANSLASDIERYLHDEPVTACPPSATYRLVKFVRRNNVAVLAGTAILTSLVIASGLSTWLYVRERAARMEAEIATSNEKQLRLQAQAASSIAEATMILRSRGVDAAEQHLAPLLTLQKQMDPSNNAQIYDLLGHFYGKQGRLNDAAVNFAKAAELEPHKFERYQYYVPLLVHREDLDGYQRVRQTLIQQFGRTTDPRDAERVLKACLITPWPNDRFDSLNQLATTALKTSPNQWTWPYVQFAKGLLDYRQGSYNSALDYMQHSVRRMDRFCDVQAYMVMAMTYHQLGNNAKARSALVTGRQYAPLNLPQEGNLLFESLWHDWMIATALHDEATVLIEGTERPRPDGTFGVVPGTFPLELAHGKHVTFSGWIKTEDLDGWAGLFWNAEGANRKRLLFKNMSNIGPGGSKDWQKYTMELDVPAETKNVRFGVLMYGKGRAWFDALEVQLNREVYHGERFGFDFESSMVKGFEVYQTANYRTELDGSIAKSGKQSLRLESTDGFAHTTSPPDIESAD
jgi:tetratricopeptide (TPR) repeat protein